MITAEKLLCRVEEYKNRKKDKNDNSTDTENCSRKDLRVFLGLSEYPDGSNLKTNVGMYSYVNEVAFFSSKEKPDLYFVLAILMGSLSEAQELICKINRDPQVNVSWDDVIEYLATQENMYFVNFDNVGFKQFTGKIIANHLHAICLLFSSNQNRIAELIKINAFDDHAAVIHPSSKNLNSNSDQWITQYALCEYNGQINGSKLKYSDFQLS